MELKLGKVGLSDPEIKKESGEIEYAVQERNPGVSIAYFYLQTPQEIHRLAALDAMSMAISLYCYNDLKSWNHYAARFMLPLEQAKDPRFAMSREQMDAHALSEAELKAIYEAQVDRMKKATIVPNVHTDEDRFSYNGINW